LATKEFLTAKDGGFYNTYSNGGKPEVAIADLGKRWELEQISLRLWPSASSTQAMNTALFDIVEKHAPAFDKIRKVRIALSEAVYNFHGKLPNYKGKFDALISAHYVAAAILHDRVLTLAQFEPARYDDPQMRRVAAELIEVRPDPAIKGNDCAVEVEMADGAKLTASCRHPRGSPQNPLTRAQIEDKFRTYAKGVISDASAEEVVVSVNRLEELSSVRKLMDLLRRAPAKAQAA
jgi:2-methylcitrate dehydratase PrpD